MGKFNDLTNQKFGKLTVIKRAPNRGRQVQWICLCDCGDYKNVDATSLRSGHTTSCGCNKREFMKNLNRKHGFATNGKKSDAGLFYNVYLSMIQRCYNEKSKAYKNYGGRGITVCDRWLESFDNFRNDMFGRWIKGLTLDRIDNNGNYCPENCRWVDRKTQCNNTRKNRFVTWRGETKTISNWGRSLGLSIRQLHKRIFYYKWDIEEAFTTPIRKIKKINQLEST